LAFLVPKATPGRRRISHINSRIVPYDTPKRAATHVRFGSEPDITGQISDVCFTPKSGHH
jgi:hypothetical protein